MLVLAWLTGALSQRASLPGIEQFGRGIDLAFSNPNGAGGADPGLRLNVFQLQSYSLNISFNNQYLVPDGISVRPAPGCSYNSKLAVIHDTQDYQENIAIRSKTTHKVLFWSHSSTEEYNYVQKRTQNSENVVVHARAECTAYSASLDLYTISGAQLSPSFVQAVQQLPSTWDPSKLFPWADFVQKFGTHFMVEATMGGTAQQSSTFSQRNFSQLVQQGTNLQDAAALDFLKLFGGDLWVNRSQNYRDYQQFASCRLEASPPLWIPQMPPSSPDVAMSADLWAQQVQLPHGTPGLISYSLQELSDLLTYQFFNSSSEPNLANKAKYLAYFIENFYCNNTGSSCNPPAINPVWKADVSLLAPRAGHCAVATGDVVYVLGGMEDQSANVPFVASVYNLHADKQWEHIASANTATAADCALLNGRVYMVGGSVGGKPVTSTAAFDPALKEWIMDQGELNVPRSSLTVQVANGQLFAIGGRNANAVNSVERYDPLTNSWEVRSAMPTARFGASSVVYGTQIIVIGGTTDGHAALNTVEIYDTVTDRWTIGTSPIPTDCIPRYFHRTVLVNDPVNGPLIYMVGGMSAGQGLDDMSIFDPVHLTWTKTNLALPELQSSGGMVLLQEESSASSIHWFGGIDLNNVPSNAHWVLELPQPKQKNDEGDFRFEGLALNNTQKKKQNKASSPSLPSLPVFPAVDYLSYGYNIIKGNPLTAAADPGWSSNSPFHIACPQCFQKGRTFLGQFLLPDGVSVEKLETCTYDAESFVSHSELDLQALLSAFVKGRAHAGIPLLLSVKFRAGLVDTVSVVAQGEMNVSIVGATATCEAYPVVMDKYTSNIVLQDNFIQGIASLPPVFDPDSPWPWFDFIEAYGTHFASGLTLGGKATQMSTVTSESLYYLQTQNVDLQACAKASFLNLFGASKQITGSMSSRAYELLTQHTESNYSFCSPACPPRGVDIASNASAWAQSLQLPFGTPVPITAALEEITELLDPSLFPKGMEQAVATQRLILTAFLNSTDNSSYCYLVGACEVPLPRPLWQLDPQLQIPGNRSGAAVALLGDTVVVSAGVEASPSPATGVMSLATQKLTLSSDVAWSWIDPFPGLPTSSAVALAVQSRMLIFGGEDGNLNPSRDVWSLSLLNRWSRLAQLPVNLTRAAGAVVGGSVYLVGGIAPGKQFSTTVYVYDVQADSWSSRTTSLPSRASASAAVLKADIFICGGYTTEVLADVLVYHTDSDTWDFKQLSLPYAVYGAAVVSLPDRFFLVGGTRADLNKQTAPSRDVYSYEPEDNAWRSLPSLPYGLTGVGAFVLNQTLYVLGGSMLKQVAVGSVYTLALDALSLPSVPSKQTMATRFSPPATARTPRTPLRTNMSNIFPLVDFAGHGYNRLRGSPLTSGRDEGWAIQPVLSLDCDTCFSQGKTFSGFAVPDVLQVDPLDSCDYSVASFVVRDAQSYQRVLQNQVTFNDDVPIPILGHLEFTASAALKGYASIAGSEGVGLTISRGRCEMYSLLLDDVMLSDLHFTDNFIAGLLSLPAVVSKDTLQPFFEFVEAFGTHLPTHLTLGGETSQVTQFADGALSQLFTLDVDLTGASQDSLLAFFGVDVSGGALAHLADYLQFSAAFTQNSTSCKPRCPPAGPDVNSNTGPWIRLLTVSSGINGTQASSVPIGMSLTAITDLIENLLNPRSISRLTQRAAFEGEQNLLVRLKSAQQNLQQFLNTEYCAMVDGCGLPPALSQWEPVRTYDPPTVVTFAATAQTNSTLYLLGGSDSKKSPVANFLSFDLGQRKWIYAPPLLEPRTQAGAAASGSCLYLVGGLVAGKPSASACVFQLSTNTWANVSSMQTARALPTVAAIGGLVYVAGGLSGPNAEASIEVYDPQVNTWSWFPAKLSVARYGAATAVDGFTFFVVGGAVTASGSQLSDCVELVNALNRSITMLLPLPVPRAFAGVFKSPQSLFLVGGLLQSLDGLNPTNDMTTLDLAQNAWYEGPSSVYARAGASFFQLDTVGLVFGGYNSTAPAMDASTQFSMI